MPTVYDSYTNIHDTSRQPRYCTHCGKRLESHVTRYDPFSGEAANTTLRCPDAMCRLMKERGLYDTA